MTRAITLLGSGYGLQVPIWGISPEEYGYGRAVLCLQPDIGILRLDNYRSGRLKGPQAHTDRLRSGVGRKVQAITSASCRTAKRDNGRSVGAIMAHRDAGETVVRFESRGPARACHS
jgi:hypothetical protein